LDALLSGESNNNKITNKDVASNALLSMLPANVTKQHEEAKMLELEKRAKDLAKNNVYDGTELPIIFGFSSSSYSSTTSDGNDGNGNDLLSIGLVLILHQVLQTIPTAFVKTTIDL
jgi:hypothetical protein